VEAGCLPHIDVRGGVPSFQFVQYPGSSIGTAGSADFPKIGDRHVFESGSGGAELRPMKYRLTGDKFREN